jgi:hypothetical protein
MQNISLPSASRTLTIKSRHSHRLNREERHLLRCYRSLSIQDRDALRWMLFAIEQISRPRATSCPVTIV